MARPMLPLPPQPARSARLVPRVHWQLVAMWLLVVGAGGVAGGLAVTSATGAPGLAPQRALALTVAPVAVAVVLFAAIYLLARRAARWNQSGIDRLAAGEYEAAAVLFRDVARQVGFGAIGSFNLGMTLLRLADVRGALGAFAAAERGGGRRGRSMLGAAVAASLALCDALLGDLEAAEAWALEARRRVQRPGHVSRLHLVAEAIALERRGHDEAAARRLAESWGEIELTTTADLMRGIRLVRAYVVERAGGTAGEVEALLAGARPFRPGEYAWLSAGWKEMEVWAAMKGFVPA